MDMSDLANAIGSSQTLKVKQTFTWGEGCCAMCCEVKNRYNIYDPEDGRLVMFATEESPCLLRQCCSPGHSFRMTMNLLDGKTKVDPSASRAQWRAFQKEIGETSSVAYTIEREGCCSKPCLGCFACNDMCTDELTLHKGLVEGDPGSIPDDTALFHAKQAPMSESMFEPKINIYKKNADEPMMTVTGPTFFGGCSELCFAAIFEAKDTEGKTRGSIVKPVPEGCCAICMQFCTNFDEFDINLAPDTTPEEKAAFVTSTILTDYMFFERDPGMCVYNDDTNMCVITLCLMYCGGCLCPCQICIPCKKD
jgi:hypothetical protein